MKIISEANFGCQRTLIACLLCISIGLLIPQVGRTNASNPSLGMLTKEQIDIGAAKYTKAVNELSRIATMPLLTEADFKKVSSIIDENIDNLRFVRYRTVQIALADSSFTRAIEDELTKGASARRCIAPLCGGGSMAEQETALQKLRQDPKPLLDFKGAREAVARMESELKHDAQALEAAGAQMQKAAGKAQSNKAHFSPHAWQNDPAIVRTQFEADANISGPIASAYEVDVIDLLGSLFVATSITSNAIGGRGGGGGRTAKAPQGTAGGGGGTGSRNSGDLAYLDDPGLDNCLDKASKAQASCKAGCQPGFFRWACLGSCDGAYIAQKALCDLGFR
jgi:hypothetical protein